MIDHAFTDLDCEALQSAARVTNPASRRVLEKCGFQWTGAGLLRIRALNSLGADRPLPARPRPVGLAQELGPVRDASGVVRRHERSDAMYQPPHFREDRHRGPARPHPRASARPADHGGPGGLLANPIPFLVYSDASAHGTLRAHLARGNPQWHELGRGRAMPGRVPGTAAIRHAVLVSDQAARHGKVVPTWNYVTVHAWGAPAGHRGRRLAAPPDSTISTLAEGRRACPEPWKVDDAPPELSSRRR